MALTYLSRYGQELWEMEMKMKASVGNSLRIGVMRLIDLGKNQRGAAFKEPLTISNYAIGLATPPYSILADAFRRCLFA